MALVGLVVFKLPSRICTYVNTTALEILEATIHSPADLKFESLLAKGVKKPFRALTKEIFSTEGLVENIVIKKNTGQNFIATLGLRKIESNGNQYLLMTFQDVTFQKKLQREIASKQEELKKTYEEILEQNRALKELDKAKDKFIALTTHELRTPLSAVVATAEFLHMHLYENEKQLHELIATINSEGQHLMVIVNDILDFSKIQTGKMEFYIEELDSLSLVQNQVDGFQKLAEQSHSTLTFRSPKTEGKCYFDSLRLNQVLANVISNAIKFNKKNGIITLAIEEQKDSVVISVKDEGVGIPKQHSSKVFSEFETIDNIKSHHKGTGLGMSISRKLIEGMGGRIWFESEEGVGTCFFIEIPKKKVLDEVHYRPRPPMDGDLAA